MSNQAKMKKILIALLFGLCCHAQEIQVNPPCVADALRNEMIRENPSLKDYLDSVDKEIADSQRSGRVSNTIPPSGSITIPVVVYIVHDGTSATNISDAQVNSQILALNNHFVNTGIKFCLATKTGTTSTIPTVNTSDVQSTPGIIHVANASLSNHSISQQQQLVATAHSSIVRNRYLRIWVVKSIGGTASGILGYSMFPNTSQVFDGIVVRADVFGNGNANMLANYNQGKVLVHEAGHYFGLYHTFEGSCVAAVGDCQYDGDRVCDTPPVANPNFNCTSGIDSCLGTPAGPDDIHNFMDYGNHVCADHFTTGQTERILWQLNMLRNDLIKPDNQVFTGTCGYGNLLASSIVPSEYSPCAGGIVNFSVVSTAGATYSWDFGDAFANASNPNSASGVSVSHTFSSAANIPYTVTLTVAKTINGIPQTVVSTAQIFVSPCTPIISDNAYWYVSRTFGLDFKSGRPVFDSTFPGDKVTQFACNAQNDSSGNLLYYTNNQKVWNKLHQQINANDLIAPSNWTPDSVMTLTVPKPTPSGPQSKYYIFSNQYNYSDVLYPDQGFKYSLVDVSGGNAVMSVERQPIVLASSYGFDSRPDGSLWGGSCVAAVAKCNGYDYWIVTIAKKSNVSYFVVFSLTSSGLSYVSETQLNSGDVIAASSGRIEIAPNGNKICFVDIYGQITRIYDFNKAEGIASTNFVALPTMQISAASFSPDSQLIYIPDMYGKKILQYNINSVNIPQTGKVVSDTENMPWNIQAGPDGKLYVGFHYIVDRLGVIHNPNAPGTQQSPNACVYSANGPKPDFPAYYGVGAGLPNPVDARKESAYFNANTSQVISTYVTGCNTYKFFPNICGTSFKWVFTHNQTSTSITSTDTDAVHTFTQNGTYTVKLYTPANVLLGTAAPITVSGIVPGVIYGSSVACTSTVGAMTSNSTTVENGETVKWSISGGAGIIVGSDNLSGVTINWTSLPGTITLTSTNSDGCISVVTKTITQDCSLAVPGLSISDVMVVPNPSDGLFTVTTHEFVGRTDLEVYDMSGRIVFNQKDVDMQNGVTVDLSQFQSGMYMLRLRGENFSIVRKLVRN